MTTIEALVAGAIRAHNTDTSDGDWDVDENRRRLPSSEADLREAHAWAGDGSPDAKGNHKLPHHEVSADGTVGPANLAACLSGIHALNRADSSVPADDRAGAYAHLVNHLKSGGRPEGSIPALKDKAEASVEDAVTAAADWDDAGMPMEDSGGAPYRRWRAPVAVLEGVWTGDDRMMEPESLTWRDLPRPLMAQLETAMGHDGAVLVGRIDTAERVDASKMVDARTGKPYGPGAWAIALEGVLDSDELAAQVAEKIRGGFLRGVSVDLSDVEYVDELVDADGESVDVDDEDVDLEGVRLRTRVTAGRVMGITATPFPAFEGAYIELLDGDGNAGPATEPGRPTREQQAAAVRASVIVPNPRRCEPCETGGLTAAAAPVEPPLGWFLDPALDGPTPITVLDDGRVFGHLADWTTCHTGITGRCVKPPRSATGYAVFRTGAVRCSGGTLVAVGQLTVGTGHASTDRGTDALATMRHYDHTGTAVADVSVGEDAYGIWVAGALRPDATPEQVRVLRASPLSGDWRPWGDGLELVAALAVNVPGFPVVRQVVASGRTTALIAAGPAPTVREFPELDEVRALLPTLTAAAARERAAQEWEARERAARAEGLRGRVRAANAASLRARVRGA